MAYWLVNSGTTEEPWTGDLRRLYAGWVEEHGDVQMFPWKPRDVRRGDTLIHRAVRSQGNRLIAVGIVTSDPEPVSHSRWPWQVHRQLIYVCRTLHVAPPISAIDVNPLGLRVMKSISDSAGERAVRLIAEAAS